MSEAPPFWFQKPGIASWLLAPAGALYGMVSARRMLQPARYESSLPVMCIGNLVAGGAGKTPTAIAVAKLAIAMGHRPGFLSRGYGGSVTRPTLVDPTQHNAHDVGDEPLMLVDVAPTVVSSDRPAGARLLEETEEVDLIIMDDGFQNPSLKKDVNLLVIDGKRGIGNGFCIPAGPMRASLKPQLAQTQAILLVGQANDVGHVIRQAARMAKPLLAANVTANDEHLTSDKKYLAFAGIADPEKFFLSLKECGLDVVEKKSFHDHHAFSQEDCQALIEQATRDDVQLITTEKDAKRLRNMGGPQEALLRLTATLPIDLTFENPRQVENLIAKAVSKGH